MAWRSFTSSLLRTQSSRAIYLPEAALIWKHLRIRNLHLNKGRENSVNLSKICFWAFMTGPKLKLLLYWRPQSRTRFRIRRIRSKVRMFIPPRAHRTCSSCKSQSRAPPWGEAQAPTSPRLTRPTWTGPSITEVSAVRKIHPRLIRISSLIKIQWVI